MATHHRKLTVPYRRQSTDYTCGPASLAMAMAFFGDHRTEGELARRASTTHDGTAHQQMISLAQREGFYVYVNTNSTIHEIKHFINQGLPVIVNYIEPDTDEGHYAVVQGYTKRGLILNDPWNGHDFRLPYITFLHRWHDTHNHHEYRRWLMVMGREQFNIGRQYLPKKRTWRLDAWRRARRSKPAEALTEA